MLGHTPSGALCSREAIVLQKRHGLMVPWPFERLGAGIGPAESSPALAAPAKAATRATAAILAYETFGSGSGSLAEAGIAEEMQWQWRDDIAARPRPSINGSASESSQPALTPEFLPHRQRFGEASNPGYTSLGRQSATEQPAIRVWCQAPSSRCNVMNLPDS